MAECSHRLHFPMATESPLAFRCRNGTSAAQSGFLPHLSLCSSCFLVSVLRSCHGGCIQSHLRPPPFPDFSALQSEKSGLKARPSILWPPLPSSISAADT